MDLTPTLPQEGPPLPQALNVRWPWASAEPMKSMDVEMPDLPVSIPKGIPHIETGKVQLNDSGWMQVNFKTPFLNPPILVPTAEYREGGYNPPKYKTGKAKISIPRTKVAWGKTKAVGVKHAPIRTYRIPRVGRGHRICGAEWEYDRYKHDCRPADVCKWESYKQAKRVLGEWNKHIGPWYIGFNSWRNGVAAGFGIVGYVAGWVIEILWDWLIQPQFDRVQDTMNHALDKNVRDVNHSLDTLKGSAQDSINRLRDTTNEGMKLLATTTNDGFNKVGSRAEKGINEVSAFNSKLTESAVNDTMQNKISREWIGMEPGMTMTPVLYRNVTPQGFEIYSLGNMTIDYIAMEIFSTGIPQLPSGGGNGRE